MAAGLHGSARTTPRVRAELQAAQASARSLAARYGLNPKTVAKWRKRTTTADSPMGPTRPRSTSLTEPEEGPEQCSIGANFRREAVGRPVIPGGDAARILLARSAMARPGQI